MCFHVLNRAVARLPLFEKPEDYDAFARVIAESYQREKLPIFSYCVMPNHWHFVVRPRRRREEKKRKRAPQKRKRGRTSLFTLLG